jgi:hypothetical protein
MLIVDGVGFGCEKMLSNAGVTLIDGTVEENTLAYDNLSKQVFHF